MAWLTAAIGVAAGLGGVLLGGFLSRRNERKAQGERLLVEALNDAVSAIAEVAGGDRAAQQRYASAVSRIALHSPPYVLESFRLFQDDATTVTGEGRKRLIRAVQAAREELGHRPARDEDIAVLLFGVAREPNI
jgi:hypothetical protein